MDSQADQFKYLPVSMIDSKLGTFHVPTMPTLCKSTLGYFIAQYCLEYSWSTGEIEFKELLRITTRYLDYDGAVEALEATLELPKWQLLSTMGKCMLSREEAEEVLKDFITAWAIQEVPYAHH